MQIVAYCQVYILSFMIYLYRNWYNITMKQQFTLKQELKQSNKFNNSKAASLKILELNNDELFSYIKSEVNNSPFLGFNHSGQEDSDAFLNYQHDSPSLYNEIMDQLRYSKDKPNIEICEAMISNLDSNGYFKYSKDELLKQLDINEREYKHNLTILRKCEPYGCFTFSLKECLKLQCILSKKKISQAAMILCDYLEDVALDNTDNIITHTKLDIETINDAIKFIRTLNPKPAANYSTEVQYTNPEFIIKVVDNKIEIQLLNDELEVFVSEENSEGMGKLLKEQRAQVTMLMNSIKRRNITLMQIMQCICDIQKEFFIHNGDLKYCTLAMIAETIGVNVSTVSRAMNNKSCEFNSKYYSLSHFLSSGGSNEHSQNHIKNRVKELIQEEDKTKPFSDEQLRLLLEDEGISISRRTVTKYRESLFIFSSTKRKHKI